MRDTEATIIEFYVSNLVPGPRNLDKFDGESRSRFSRSRTLWTDRTWNARRCRTTPRRSIEEGNDFLGSRGYFTATANTRARFLSERDHRTQSRRSFRFVRVHAIKCLVLRFEIGVNPCFRRSLFLRRVIVITTVPAITSASSASHGAISTKDSTGSKGRADCFFYSDRRRSRCFDSRRPTSEKTSGSFSQLRRLSSLRLVASARVRLEFRSTFVRGSDN